MDSLLNGRCFYELLAPSGSQIIFTLVEPFLYSSIVPGRNRRIKITEPSSKERLS